MEVGARDKKIKDSALFQKAPGRGQLGGRGGAAWAAGTGRGLWLRTSGAETGRPRANGEGSIGPFSYSRH